MVGGVAVSVETIRLFVFWSRGRHVVVGAVGAALLWKHVGGGGGGCAGGEESMWAVARGRWGRWGAVGAGGAGGRAGAAIEHYSLFSSLLSSKYGSMWAVGAVGVLEERKACGQWRGRVGAVARVVVLGSNMEHYFLFSFFESSEYGSMWAVGAVGVLEERRVGAVRAVAGGAGGRAGAAIEHDFLFFSLSSKEGEGKRGGGCAGGEESMWAVARAGGGGWGR